MKTTDLCNARGVSSGEKGMPCRVDGSHDRKRGYPGLFPEDMLSGQPVLPGECCEIEILSTNWVHVCFERQCVLFFSFLKLAPPLALKINPSHTHTPLSSSSGLAFQNLPSTASVSVLDQSWWVTLCASAQKCTCTVFVLHLQPRWKDAKRKSSMPIKTGRILCQIRPESFISPLPRQTKVSRLNRSL